MAKDNKYTQKTLEHLRDRGCFGFLVERRIPPREGLPYGKTVDLMGFADLFVLNSADESTFLVQSTGPSGMPEHRRTIMTSDWAAMYVLECAGEIEIYSWRKLLVKRGGKARQWKPRILLINRHTWKEGGQEVERPHAGISSEVTGVAGSTS